MWFRWKMDSIRMRCQKTWFSMKSSSYGGDYNSENEASNISDLYEVFRLWQTIQSVIQMDNKMMIASHWEHLVILCEKDL